MQLQEILDQLRYSELQHIKIGGHADGTGITNEHMPAIITHLNLALTALHTEFPLRKETVHIDIHESISTYFMDSEFAASNTGSTQPIKYIADTSGDPYNDNLTFIEKIEDELGNEYSLNVENDCDSITLPIYNAFNFPLPADGLTVKVSYRANHVKIPTTATETTNIDIPMSLLNCLLLFIKHRVYSSLPSLSGMQVAQVTYNQYLVEVENMKNSGVINMETSNNERQESNQWA